MSTDKQINNELKDEINYILKTDIDNVCINSIPRNTLGRRKNQEKILIGGLIILILGMVGFTVLGVLGFHDTIKDYAKINPISKTIGISYVFVLIYSIISSGFQLSDRIKTLRTMNEN